MKQADLRSLSRAELLELLIEQGEELERTKEELQEAQRMLQEKKLALSQAGSIAEASLQVSGIFEAAQAASQQYLENVKHLSERQDAIARIKERETREKCERMEAEAQLRAQQCWDNCSAKIKQLVDSFEGLQQVMDLYSSLHKKNEKPVTESVQAGVYGRIY